MDAKTLFDEKMPKVLIKNPDKARELNAIYFFHVTGDGGGKWTVDLKANPPVVQAGDAGKAECSIEITSEDFKAMMGDPQLAFQLYFQGKLKVVGDPMLATKLQTLFKLS
jgi:hypothetical protein